MHSCTPTSLCSTTRATARSTPWLSTARGVNESSHPGLDMAKTFEYAQAEEIRDAFARHGVRYLFIGKSGAILLGYPDTTQDADIFAEKSPENGRALAAALKDLGFALTGPEASDLERGKALVQLKNGPFDLD